MSSHPARRAPHALAGSLLALSLALAGCGVRLDTPPPPLPSPDAAETARQSAALGAVGIATLAQDVPEPAREGLADLAADSRAHAAALGGIWCRERWRAAVPAAGLNAARQGTDIWFAAGLLAAVRHDLGRAGVLAAGGEILWVDAQRRAIGANPAQAEPLDAGWIALRLGWTPRPARAVP